MADKPTQGAIDAALDVMESEAMLWLMAGSSHPEAQIAMLRDAWRAYCEEGGRSWPSSTRDYLTGGRDLGRHCGLHAGPCAPNGSGCVP